MPLVQAVYNVRILLVNVPAMLATKEQNVMLLVVVTLLVQVVQHVIAMSLDQAVRKVQILLVSVLAMLVIRAPNVILLVVVIPLVQVVLHVISLQVNVLAIQDTQEPHAIPVLPITTKQVMVLLVQVSVLTHQ